MDQRRVVLPFNQMQKHAGAVPSNHLLIEAFEVAPFVGLKKLKASAGQAQIGDLAAPAVDRMNVGKSLGEVDGVAEIAGVEGEASHAVAFAVVDEVTHHLTAEALVAVG